MKILSHVVVLALGFGLGLWVSRGSVQPSAPSSESTSAVPAPESSEDRPAEALASSSPETSAPDLLVMKEDFENQMNQGSMRQAILIVQEMEKADSQAQIFLESQSRLLMRQREFDQAKVALKKCVANYPQSKSCLVDLASAELQVGSKEEQAAAIRQCLDVAPSDPQCRNMSALNFMNFGDYNAAIQIYQDLLRDNGSYGFRFMNGMLDWQLALALEGVGRQDDALEHFEKACQQNYADACNKLEDLSGGGMD